MIKRDNSGVISIILTGLLLVFRHTLALFLKEVKIKMSTSKKTKGKKPEWGGYINPYLQKDEKEMFKAHVAKGGYGLKALSELSGKGFRTSITQDENGAYKAVVTGLLKGSNKQWSVSGFSGQNPIVAIAMAYFYLNEILDWEKPSTGDESGGYEW